MNSRNEKVMVYLPARGGEMSVKTCVGLVQSRGMWDMLVDNVGGSFIPKLKAQACWLALREKVDRLVLLDADIEFTGEEFSRLIEMDGDVCGGLYTRTTMNGGWVLRTLTPIPLPDSGIVEVDAVGGGFMAVRTAILPEIVRLLAEQEESFWNKLSARIKANVMAGDAPITDGMKAEIKEAIKYSAEPFYEDINKVWMHDLFSYKIMDARDYWTDDFLFCRMARRCGFKIWCDLGLHVRHRGGHSWIGVEQYDPARMVKATGPAEIGGAMPVNFGGQNVSLPTSVPQSVIPSTGGIPLPETQLPAAP